MKSFLKYVLATFVAITLFILIGIGILASISSKEEVQPLDKDQVLCLTLKGSLSERSPEQSIMDMVNKKESISTNEIIETLHKAQKDDHIKSVFVNIKGLSASINQIEMLRNAFIAFRASEKDIHVYSDNFSQGQYYLATGGSKIYMSPNGNIEWKGLSSQIYFFTNALKNLGINVQIIRHGQFKAAVEPFMLTEMSEANELQNKKLIGDLWSHLLTNISEARSLSIENLNQFADSLSITSPKTALKNGMIDELVYESDLRERVVEEFELTIKDYIAYNDYKKIPEVKKGEFKKSKIAILYAEGDIVFGKGDKGKLGSDDLIKQIRKIKKDEKVKAVVLRINSPGGSALASDLMWYELKKLKEQMPLVVSMGDLAASGGYYIAACGDTILAEPTTITGSIGVFGMLPNIRELAEDKLGVNYDYVNTNDHSNFGSMMQPLNEFEYNKIHQGVVEVYETFVNVVSEGRNLTYDQVDAIGQGRVWSGISAKEIGLVDIIGGKEQAIAIAAELAGLSEYRTEEFPKSLTFEEKLMQSFESSTKLSAQLPASTSKFLAYFEYLNQAKGIQARLPYFIEIE